MLVTAFYFLDDGNMIEKIQQFFDKESLDI